MNRIFVFLKKHSLNLGFALAVFSGMLLLTHEHHVGVAVDSVSYIETAKNILSKGCICLDNGELTKHWPPLYPILLAGITAISGISIAESANLMNAIALGLLLFFFIEILKQYKIRKWMQIFLGGILIFSYPVAWFTFLMTEGPFMASIVIAYFLINRSYKKPPYYLLGVYFGFLFLLRYAAIGYIIPLSFIVLLRYNSINRQFIRNGLKMALCFIILVLPWILTVKFLGPEDGIRQMVWHPVSINNLWSLFYLAISWGAPAYTKIVGPAILIALITLFGLLLKRSDFKERLVQIRQIVPLLGIAFFFLFFLLTSISLFDAATPVDNRILSACYPFLLIAAGVLLNSLNTNKLSTLIIAALLSMLLAANVKFILPTWQMLEREGMAYSCMYWKHHPVLEEIKKEAEKGKLIYTNSTEPLKFHQPEYKSLLRELPLLKSPYSQLANPDFKTEFEVVEKAVNAEKAIIVNFSNSIEVLDYKNRDEIKAHFPESENIAFKEVLIVK